MTDEQIADTLEQVGASWLMDDDDEACQANALRHLVDAAEAIERKRIFAHIRSAMGHAEAGYDDVAWRLLASLVGPN